mmetsp:Transcript_29341/g.87427  ORF Transcript_29341/g.87427 Transcript_29341/m.87427 type:complete len:444 (+) Transcript_29341:162-1493(+)
MDADRREPRLVDERLLVARARRVLCRVVGGLLQPAQHLQRLGVGLHRLVDRSLEAGEVHLGRLLAGELEARREPADDVQLVALVADRLVAVAEQRRHLGREVGHEVGDGRRGELVGEGAAGELDRVEDELTLAALDGRLARLVQVDVEHEQALQRLDGRPATERQLLAKEERAGGLREHPVVPEPHPDVGHDHLQPVWRAVGQQLRRGELLPPPLEVVVAGAQLEDERLKVDQAHVPGGEGLRGCQRELQLGRLQAGAGGQRVLARRASVGVGDARRHVRDQIGDLLGDETVHEVLSAVPAERDVGVGRLRLVESDGRRRLPLCQHVPAVAEHVHRGARGRRLGLFEAVGQQRVMQRKGIVERLCARVVDVRHRLVRHRLARVPAVHRMLLRRTLEEQILVHRLAGIPARPREVLAWEPAICASRGVLRARRFGEESKRSEDE